MLGYQMNRILIIFEWDQKLSLLFWGNSISIGHKNYYSGFGWQSVQFECRFSEILAVAAIRSYQWDTLPSNLDTKSKTHFPALALRLRFRPITHSKTDYSGPIGATDSGAMSASDSGANGATPNHGIWWLFSRKFQGKKPDIPAETAPPREADL